jgi:cytochrome c peroxidase
VSRSPVVAPLPPAPVLDAKKLAFGERLYNDPHLSGDGEVACRDCHSLETGGAVHVPRSPFPGRKPLPVNVPTVFNVAYDFRYAWNGRFETIEDQVDFAMNAPAAMGGSMDAAVRRVEGDEAYARAFRDVYGRAPDAVGVRDALADYCRSLVTPNSRFDRFLLGVAALSPEEKAGYDAFVGYGCVTCHQGVNIGGNMFQRFGVMRDYFADRGDLTEADLGRYNVTKDDADRHVFRVPSLRNVARTAPYFHDGNAATLEEAVTVMALFQLGRHLPARDVQAIVAFLGSLTGELNGRPL